MHIVKKKKHPKVVQSDPSGSLHYPIFITCRHFLSVKLYIPSEGECFDVHVSLRSLSQPVKLEHLHAFHFRPNFPYKTDGWKFFDAIREFERIGVGHEGASAWRFSDANKSFDVHVSTCVSPL